MKKNRLEREKGISGGGGEVGDSCGTTVSRG